MKQISKLILMAALVLVAACGGEDEPGGGGGTDNPPAVVPSVTLATGTNTNPVLTTDGGSVEVSFTATTSWTASVINTRADGWVTVSPTSGNAGSGKVTITAQKNETPDERGATIQIKCGTATQSIVLTQKQKDSFTASASKTEIGKEGGTVTIEVQANVEFTHTLEATGDWITLKETKALSTHTLVFEVKANEDIAKRQATIKVTSSAGSETFTVYQAGADPTILLTNSTYSIGVEGGTVDVEVSSNIDVAVTIQDNCTWVKEITTKAMSTNTWHFSVEANEAEDSRTAEILFENKENGVKETVTIIQAGTATVIEMIPGISGISGFNWTYRSGTDQMLCRKVDDRRYFILMEPSSNKVCCLKLPKQDTYDAGTTVDVTITQNIDKNQKAVIDMKLLVVKQEDRYLWLTDGQQHTAIIMLD